MAAAWACWAWFWLPPPWVWVPVFWLLDDRLEPSPLITVLVVNAALGFDNRFWASLVTVTETWAGVSPPMALARPEAWISTVVWAAPDTASPRTADCSLATALAWSLALAASWD